MLCAWFYWPLCVQYDDVSVLQDELQLPEIPNDDDDDNHTGGNNGGGGGGAPADDDFDDLQVLFDLC